MLSCMGWSILQAACCAGHVLVLPALQLHGVEVESIIAGPELPAALTLLAELAFGAR
jgi:hypothetical protein